MGNTRPRNVRGQRTSWGAELADERVQALVGSRDSVAALKSRLEPVILKVPCWRVFQASGALAGLVHSAEARMDGGRISAAGILSVSAHGRGSAPRSRRRQPGLTPAGSRVLRLPSSWATRTSWTSTW